MRPASLFAQVQQYLGLIDGRIRSRGRQIDPTGREPRETADVAPTPRAEPAAPAATPGATHLYFLVHDRRPIFKIGISYEPARRAALLPQADQIDWVRSRHVAISTRPRAFEIEKALHKALAPYAHRLKGDGGTEWFDLSALPTARKLLQAIPAGPKHRDLLKLSGFVDDDSICAESANLDALRAAANLWIQASQVVNARRRAENTLVLEGFRDLPLEQTPWRLDLVNVDTYRLRRDPAELAPPGVAAPCLVHLIAYDSERPHDLTIRLAPFGALSRLPAGEEIVQELNVLLSLLALSGARQ